MPAIATPDETVELTLCIQAELSSTDDDDVAFRQPQRLDLIPPSAAACISRNRSAHGFGDKSLKPRSSGIDFTLDGLGKQGMEHGRCRSNHTQGDCDHRMVVRRTAGNTPWRSTVLAPNSVPALAPVRSTCDPFSRIETPSGSCGSPCTVSRASLQSAIQFGGWPGIATVAGPLISPTSQSGARPPPQS